MHDTPCHSMWNGVQHKKSVAPQGDLLRSARKNGLLFLDARGVDDLLPARNLALQILAEILWRRSAHFETLRGKTLLNARLAQ